MNDVPYVEPAPDLPEELLQGGDVTEGLVRIGDTVRRPFGPQSLLVRAVLQHLERTGFEGAPRFLGVDGQGREVLSFLPGEVASRPLPAWFRADDRLASVARLLRRYHEAMAGFEVPAGLEGSWELPGLPRGIPSVEEPEEVLGHQDITPDNVVFRDGEAFALIDFDLARPASRLLEVLNALTHWGPLTHPDDRDPALTDEEVTHRCVVFADAYGLDAASRERFVPVAVVRSRRSWHLMRHRAETDGGGWQRMWDEGVGDLINRRVEWLEKEGDRVGAALSGSRQATPPEQR
jgi:hypothetical protein